MAQPERLLHAAAFGLPPEAGASSTAPTPPDPEREHAARVPAAGLGFYESDDSGRIVFADGVTRALLGIVPGDARPGFPPWVERIHPDDRERVVEEFRAVWSGRADRTATEYRYVSPDGGVRWIGHLLHVLSRGAPGNAARSIGVVEDITERKRAEQALRDLAERYEAITSTTTDGFWEVDAQGRLRAVNDEASRMSGYGREELLTMSIADLEASQSPLEIRQTIAMVAARGQSRFETRHRRRDGRVIDVEISTTSRPGGGTFLVFVRDVTQRTQAEARLHESLEFTRTILASLVDRLVILDRGGTILSINDAWERFALEHGGTEALSKSGVGVNYLDVCRRAREWRVLEGIESVLRRRHDIFRLEYAAHAPSETRWYMMEAMPLRRTEGGAVVVHQDITTRRRAEAELHRLRMDNWHAHRVAQTGAIAASLAHELNQPLAAILSNAQAGARLLAAERPDLEEIRAILADIVQDDKRAAAVIAGLRAMMRREQTRRERLDLASLVQGGLALAHSELITHNVVVDLRVEAGCDVIADSAQIQQVVLNLVLNAVEAMDAQPPERRRLEISLEDTPAGEALLAVRDRGPGIPADQQEKLFESFWTTKAHGMGVGLPICRSIIESHGGHLWFVNNEGGGATFFVSLPSSGPEDAPAT